MFGDWGAPTRSLRDEIERHVIRCPDDWSTVWVRNGVTLCDLRVLVGEAAESIASMDASVVGGGGWSGFVPSMITWASPSRFAFRNAARSFGARLASNSTVSFTYRRHVVVDTPNPAPTSANGSPLCR